MIPLYPERAAYLYELRREEGCVQDQRLSFEGLVVVRASHSCTRRQPGSFNAAAIIALNNNVFDPWPAIGCPTGRRSVLIGQRQGQDRLVVRPAEAEAAPEHGGGAAQQRHRARGA